MRFPSPRRRMRGAPEMPRAVRPVLDLLEDRTVLSTTAQQQFLLELTNRMRADPSGELAIDINVPAVQQEMARDGTDLALLQQQWATLTSAPPLAWSDALAGTASNHSQYMDATSQFGHNLPGEPTFQARLNSAGDYVGGENIYYGQNDLQVGHALLAVDPQAGAPGGLEPGVGHRANIMNPSFTQVGSGFAVQANTGALFLTEDFGAAAGGPNLLGVVYRDTDGNQFYGIGEGLGGVTVTATGATGTFKTTTWSSGGYQMPLPAGTYTVTFSGGGLSAPQSRMVVVGSRNVKLDAVDAAAASVGSVRTGVAISLTTSSEYYNRVVATTYQKLLGRSAEPAGLQYWGNALRSGMRVEQLEAAIASSQEYVIKQGGIGANWVRGLYRDLLGRTAAWAEVNYWLGQLLHNGLYQVAFGFSDSTERLGQRVAGYYQTYLGRLPSAAEVQLWVSQMQGGLTGEQLAAGFLASDEFFLHHGGTNSSWVTAAYWAAFDRAPNQSEVNYWAQLL